MSPLHACRLGALSAFFLLSFPGCLSEGAQDPLPGSFDAGTGEGDGEADADGVPDETGDGVPAGDGADEDGDPDTDEQPKPAACAEGGSGTCVRTVGRQLFVNGQPFHVRGVSWNPIPRGGTHPAALDYEGFADQDIPLMQQAGINVVRTYEPIEDTGVLDKLHAAGIYVINSVYPWGGAQVALAVERVNRMKNHPAILMWLVGNEWNYNQLYTGGVHDLAWTKQRVEEVARAIKGADDSHPVASSHGHTPGQDVFDDIPSVDVWGVNIYTGIEFAGLFDEFRRRTQKPLMITEYGADAWNSNVNGTDLNAQADATRALTELIFDNASADDPTQLCVGGTIYSWVDEWDKAGNPAVQDSGGSAPGGGPHPDATFNEEYWGIVDIDRNPRAAYWALKEVFDAH